MADNLHTIQLGGTSVTLINIGDVHEDVNLWFKLTEPERAQYAPLLAQPARLTIYNVHFALPTASILVDAGAYDYPPDAPQLIPGYTPPPDLLTTLRTAAIQPEAITHVIITHAHAD
jgi:glyoxylase-like metal-dependent hydrolase (beta-lactamase superfamily II)